MSKINPPTGPADPRVSRKDDRLRHPAAAAMDEAMAERFFMTHRQIAATTSMLAQEMVDFTGRRLRAQTDFVSEVLRCGDLPTLMEAQLRFFTAASRDYAEEMTRVSASLRSALEPDAAEPANAA